ncbi:MAG: copper amine oxidase N-terminal domain-containing protein [Defluviitaleaceae bacterium]|nr:copper amine oxidase N-terminal domain-containing protein [Defluviitaleaceae bacterium]
MFKAKHSSLALMLIFVFLITSACSRSNSSIDVEENGVSAMSLHADFDISAWVNGEIVAFGEQKPIILDGITFMPLCETFEAMGFYVLWDEEKQTVSLSDGLNSAFFVVGQSSLIARGGNTIEMDVPAQIINERIMLPLSAVAEVVGARVFWDSKKREIDIDYNKPNFNFNTQTMTPYPSEFMIRSVYHEGKIATNLITLYLVFPNKHIENNEIVSAIASVGGVLISHSGGSGGTRRSTIQISPRSESELHALGEFMLAEFPHLFDEYFLYDDFGDTIEQQPS